MAVALSPETSSITRDTDFTITISAVGDAGETIDSISVVADSIDSGVTVVGDTISGQYNDQFSDELTYVSKGSSDLLETPTTIYGTGNMPPDKDLFRFICDSAKSVDITYTVTVEYTDALLVPSTEELIYTVTVENDLDGYVTWLRSYVDY